MEPAMAETAGQKLRKDFDAALDRTSKSLGKKLRWDETELHALEAAANAADRREKLAKLFDDELSGEARTGVLVTLSVELRQLDKAVAFHMGRIKIGPGPAKQAAKVRAATERWRRYAEQKEEAENGVG
jgi:hypothetical protein